MILDPLGGAVRRPWSGGDRVPVARTPGHIQWYVGLPLTRHTRRVAEAYDWIDRGHRVLAPASVGGYVNYLEPGRPVARTMAPTRPAASGEGAARPDRVLPLPLHGLDRRDPQVGT